MKQTPFEFSDDNKRYHTLSFHNRRVFGERIYKAAIDAGFTCPNIDGSCGRGGCVFCDGGSGYFAEAEKSVVEQLEREIARIHAKTPDARIIAYFQSHSNTYAAAEKLREIYEPVMKNPYVAGISVGTRADCFDEEIYAYLSELSRRTYLTVELGLQTVHDATAEKINRGYGCNVFFETFARLKALGIRTCVHIIDGLPDESAEMMLETAAAVGRLRPEAVKIHLLHIIRGTRAEEMYKSGEITPLTREEYIDVVTRQLELLPPETVIERVTGDGDKKKLVAPLWSIDKISVLGGIDRKMAEADTYQGRRFGAPPYSRICRHNPLRMI